MSLPSMAQQAMMKSFDKNSPTLRSLPWFAKEYLAVLNANKVGGIVTNPHRFVSMDPEIVALAPAAASKAPNGDPYKSFVAYDFNR
jgi:hypothetical protein